MRGRGPHSATAGVRLDAPGVPEWRSALVRRSVTNAQIGAERLRRIAQPSVAAHVRLYGRQHVFRVAAHEYIGAARPRKHDSIGKSPFMTRNKNAKLTPTKVNVRLASGRTIQAVRHKNLVPRPTATTPPAGPVSVPDQAEELPEIKKPVFYASTMGGFISKYVLDEEEADAVCAKTYFQTLESYDAWGDTVSVEVEWRPLRLEFDGWTLVNGVEVVYPAGEPPVGLQRTNWGTVELAYLPYSIPQGASYADEVDSGGDAELEPGEYRITSPVNLSS